MENREHYLEWRWRRNPLFLGCFSAQVSQWKKKKQLADLKKAEKTEGVSRGEG